MATIVSRKKKGATLPIVVSTSPRGNNPQCIVLPIVTGTATIGSTVTVSQGTWLNNPGTFYYQWQRNLSDIPGAVFTNYVLQNADLNQSITCLVTAWNAQGNGIARTAAFVPIAGGGSAAVLSSPTASATGPFTATLGVTTDTGSGTLYWVVSTSSTPPSAAQIIAGNDSSGSAAPKAGSQTVSATGAQSISATGLSSTTTYFSYFVQFNGLNSNVASAASFTTGTMSTPTLAISSATGTAPLTLSWSDADYMVGNYGQLEIDQTSNAFSNITQNIIFFVDGASWATLDESIGLITPSGTYWARIRGLRDNDTGATAVTGNDTRGNPLSFNADASAWSNTVTDTINVSSAALTSSAGTNCSKLLSVTGTPALSWNIPSGNGGAIELTRATISAQHTDTYCELTVGTVAGNNIIGMTDASSIDFNGGGSGFFSGGTAYPGDTGQNGFSIVIDGASTFVGWHANGTSGAFSAGGTGNTAAGDIIGLEYNSSTHVVTVFYKRGAAAMAQIGTITLTSLIPATPFAFTGGKSNLDAATWNPGKTTFVLGSTGPQGSPSGSNIYG